MTNGIEAENKLHASEQSMSGQQLEIDITPSESWKCGFADIEVQGVYPLFLVFQGTGIMELLELEWETL